jgi:hypothetical protein
MLGDLPLVTLGGVRTLLGLNEKEKTNWVCFGLERDCLTDVTDTGKRILCECVLQLHTKNLVHPQRLPDTQIQHNLL